MSQQIIYNYLIFPFSFFFFFLSLGRGIIVGFGPEEVGLQPQQSPSTKEK